MTQVPAAPAPGMITAVEVIEESAPAPEPSQADRPELVGGRVKVSGLTPDGVRVELVDYDADRMVDDESEYDAWPDQPKDRPLLLGQLLVELTDAHGSTTVVGVVSWHRVAYGPTSGSYAWNVGIGLAPPSRGLGIGTLAQRLLVEWLFDTTPVHRIEASTDVGNLAEQKALERAGFSCEGVLRSAQERADGRHDLCSYSILRSDL